MYPFRHAAYIFGVLFSILLASLAFVNPKDGYVTQGTFCYLPPRPFWYRLALAWIPRYLILATILSIYIAVFVYVRTKLNSLDVSSAMSYELALSTSPIISPADNVSRRGSSTHGLHMLPLHSLKVAPKAKVAADTSNNHGQLTSLEPLAPRMHTKASHGPSDRPKPVWERYSFGRLTPIPNVLPEEELEPTRPINSQYPRRNPTILEALQERSVSWTKPIQSKATTAPLDAQAQRDAPTELDVPNTATSAMSGMKAPCVEGVRDVMNVSLRRRHKAIKRQLRFVFVYPLVYLLTWIVPFINHCFQYNDDYAKHPEFPLACASTTIIALQCAIDCWLFGYREKPWRLIYNDDITFWQSCFLWKRRNSSECATPLAIERKSEVGIEPKNWWSQEEIFRDTSTRRESEDPMIEKGAGSMAAGLRRGVQTYKSGGNALMASGGVNLALVRRLTGTSIQQLVIQESPAKSESRV